MAEAWVGISDFLPPDTVFLSYNDWFSDREYREKKAFELGIDEFTDAGLEEVPMNGTGSSFDFREKAGKAQSMKVLERWKAMYRNPMFRKHHTGYVDQLSRQIFGFDMQDLRKDLPKKEPVDSPYVVIKHPCQSPVTANNCRARCDEIKSFIKNSPLGDYDHWINVPLDRAEEITKGLEEKD
jgi:hypothetical protein